MNSLVNEVVHTHDDLAEFIIKVSVADAKVDQIDTTIP